MAQEILEEIKQASPLVRKYLYLSLEWNTMLYDSTHILEDSTRVGHDFSTLIRETHKQMSDSEKREMATLWGQMWEPYELLTFEGKANFTQEVFNSLDKKSDGQPTLAQDFMEYVYEAIKHGDIEHRVWLHQKCRELVGELHRRIRG